MTHIAVLYPGAMGRALAEALKPSGHRLLTDLAKHSVRTRENARCAAIADAGSFAEVVGTADLIVSVVPPTAARSVAQRYAEAYAAQRSRGRDRADRAPLFLDANSIAPSTVRGIESIVRGAGARFVDGVFLGPAAMIGRGTLLMLSGQNAAEAAEILGSALPVRVVGDVAGPASAVKMAIALMTKALVALFLEMGCAAGKAGCLEPTLDAMRQLYPGTMEFLERNLPTYQAHAPRRLGEMREVQSWLAELGEAGMMSAAATCVLGRLAGTVLEGADGTFDGLLHEIVRLEILATDVPDLRRAGAA